MTGDDRAETDCLAENWRPTFPAETIILGFTGPLGSGCTYVSEEVARQAGFFHHQMSRPIHDKARQRGDRSPSFETKQAIGNILRKSKGVMALAELGCQAADEAWRNDPNKYNGIVLDGIRNSGEVDFLRQFPNFFLVAVHATSDTRFERLRRANRIQSQEEFDRADERDAQERHRYGQQVKECTYRADIIFENEKDIATSATEAKSSYVRDEFLSRYVTLIQKLIAGQPTHEHSPRLDETLMTMAYASSQSSRCAKRKVGAVVANEHGNVISAGYNDVPEGVTPCVFDAELNGCLRDRLQEEFGSKIAYCPRCGTEIKGPFRCGHCDAEIPSFSKRCPECDHDPEIDYTCEKEGCGAQVFEDFVPGGTARHGKLLDMCRSLHAEENALLYLARDGSGVPSNGTLYTTTFPCNLCANKIAAAGIKKVVYAEPYPMKEAMDVLQMSGIEIVKFEGVKSSAFFRLYR